MLEAVVTVPTASPDVVIAVDAAAWVRFTTSGTATYGRPDETTRATVEPITTSAPADGFSEMMLPAGTVVLDAVVTVPTVSPAVVSAVLPAACVIPTTFGTLTCGSPVEIVSVTVLV